MKRIALITALLAGAAHAAGPVAPYYPAPHIVWDGTGGFQSTFQPTILAASLVSASGTGNDWAAMTGAGGGAVMSPNAYAGLLVCTANCTDSLRAQWQPWSGSGGGGGGTPASPANSVQYNNAGSFGAVPLNTTGTRQFLLQTSSGAPSFAALASGDIPNNAANTTGNAATATNAATVGNASSTLSGIRQANTGALDTAATSGQIAGALNTSPSTKLSSQLLPTGLISVAQVGNLWGNWDSYGYGLGPLNPAKFAPFQLVSADVPAPFTNLSANGLTINGIANLAYTNYQPSPLGLPDVALIGAGENDSGCASATAACGYSFKEMMMALLLHWLDPPTFSNSIWASAATRTGTAWVADGGVYGTFNKTSPGTPMASTASGGTMTFNIPSSPATKIYIKTVAKTSNTGTYTATINGTIPLIDEFSGTTTFSGAPLSANPAISSLAVYAQAFAVPPNTPLTLVITATGTVEIDKVVTNAYGASDPANMAYHYNVAPILGSFATWNTIDAALDASLKTDGFLVGAVDLVNGTSTTSTQWSSINPTTFPQAGAPYTAADFATSATVACTASQAASHPNECGGLDFYRNFLNAQANLGVIISRVSLGAKYPEQTGKFYVAPSLYSPIFTPTYKDLSFNGGVGANGKCFETFNGQNQYNGICGWQNQNTLGQFPWSQKFMQGPVGNQNLFWWCGAYLNSYFDTNPYSNSQFITWCDSPTGVGYRTQNVTAPETVTFSATPTFSAVTEISRLILTGNITSSTLAAGDDGAHKTIILCQDATGSRTFVPPTNVFGFGTIGTTASKCNTQSFFYSTLAGYVGWYATGALVMNE